METYDGQGFPFSPLQCRTFLSMFPGEAETLFPQLTFVQTAYGQGAGD